MAWLQLSVTVAGEQIEPTVVAFEAIGSQATTQKNAGEQSYFDLAHPAEPKWDVQTVSGLFPDNNNETVLISLLQEHAPFVTRVDKLRFDDCDWETVWQDQYQPIEVCAGLWIYPSWESTDGQSGTMVKIDPGMAFGTGTHETTRLCMQILARLNLEHQSVLDYGCGSGILAITALKFGANEAIGVDIDPKAEVVSEQNAHNNGVASRFAIQSAADLDKRDFDIVVANILAHALINLAPELISRTRGKGQLVLSGILAHQADGVIDAYQHAFSFERYQEAEWVALLGKKLDI